MKITRVLGQVETRYIQPSSSLSSHTLHSSITSWVKYFVSCEIVLERIKLVSSFSQRMFSSFEGNDLKEHD